MSDPFDDVPNPFGFSLDEAEARFAEGSLSLSEMRFIKGISPIRNGGGGGGRAAESEPEPEPEPEDSAVIGETNILTDAEQLDVPDWILYGAVTDGGLTVAPGPDGVLPARKLHIPASSGSDANVAYNTAGAEVVQYTGSMWMRGTLGGEEVYLHVFNVPGNVGGSLRCVLTTSWQQFEFTATGFTPFVDLVSVEVGYDGSFGALTAVAACDIEVAYAQAEEGASASP